MDVRVLPAADGVLHAPLLPDVPVGTVDAVGVVSLAPTLGRPAQAIPAVACAAGYEPTCSAPGRGASGPTLDVWLEGSPHRRTRLWFRRTAGRLPEASDGGSDRVAWSALKAPFPRLRV